MLEGSGTLRIREREVVLSRGDYVALPAGEAHAHQIFNTSNELLRYLCFSTMAALDILVYPDSGKVGLFGSSALGSPKEKRTLQKYLRAHAEVSYFDGEK